MQNLVLRLIRLYFAVAGRLAPAVAARQALGLFTTPRFQRPPSPQDREVMAAAEVLDLRFSPPAPQGAQDGRLRVYRWRRAEEAEAAPRVLLVHGWESRASRLARWVEPLRSAGFEVLAVDLPAHGDSDGRRTFPSAAAAALAAVAATAGPFHAVVGHSFGAVCAVVAVAGGALTGLPAFPAEKLVLVAGSDSLTGVIARFGAMVGLPGRVVERLHGEIGTLSGHPIEAWSASSMMACCALPTLVVHDRDDDEIPWSDGEAIAAAAPAATLVATEGLGHHRVVRDPAVISRATAFLEAP